jgi:hypothetical protein
LVPSGRDGVDEVVLRSGDGGAVGQDGGRRRDVPAGGEPPAERPVRVDGVDGVAARIDDAVAAHGRSRVHVAPARLGAHAHALRARSDLEAPHHAARGEIERVEVIVVGADVRDATRRQRGRAEDEVPGGEAPERLSVLADDVELAVVAPHRDGAVGW